MKNWVHLFFLFAGICLCSKRARYGGKPNVVTRKRAKTTISMLRDSILQEKTEEFTEILNDTHLTGVYSALYLDNGNADKLLVLAIGHGKAKIIQRMMGIERFKDILDFHHLEEALLVGSTDALHELVNAWKYEVGTHPKAKDDAAYYSGEERKLYHLAAHYPHRLRLLSRKFTPLHHELSALSARSAYGALLAKYLENRIFHVSEREFEILHLCGLYSPSFGLAFFINEIALGNDNSERPSSSRSKIIKTIASAIECLDNEDLEGLQSVITGIENRYEYLVQLSLMIVEATENRGLYSFLGALFESKRDILTGVTSFFPHCHYYNLYARALIDGEIDKVTTVLKSMSMYINEASLSKLLLKIANEWVAEGNLGALMKSSDFANDLFKLTDEHRCYIRLAQRVSSGDWRYLLVFMELHPNKLLLINAAWDMIFCQKSSDTFLDFVGRTH